MKRKRAQVVYINTVLNILLFMIPILIFLTAVKIKVGEFNMEINNLEYENKVANLLAYNYYPEILFKIDGKVISEYLENLEKKGEASLILYICETSYSVKKEYYLNCYYRVE